MKEQALTIRAATPSDADVMSRLAELDSRPRLGGRALLAERDGVAIAAVSLTSGSIVADPFQPVADAVRLLRYRRWQLLRQSGDAGPARSLLRRLAPAVSAAS
jgi:hypothetical protein